MLSTVPSSQSKKIKSTQIEEHEAASGQTLPALMRVPGATKRVSAVKLVAVTGARFLFKARGAPRPQKRPRSASPDAAAGVAVKVELEDGGAGPSAPVATAAADGADQAADDFVAILNGRAPPCLSAHAAMDLVRVAQRCEADAVLQALPAYLKPLITDLAPSNVRLPDAAAPDASRQTLRGSTCR